MQQPRNNSLIYLAIAAVLVIGLVVALILHHGKTANTAHTAAGNATVTKDPTSGQTVRTIPGENQNIGRDPDAPIFLGINPLITQGLSTNQSSNMQAAFENYSVKNKLGIKQVSIDANTIKSSEIDAADGSRTYVLDFDVVFDSTTRRHATLHYSGLSTVELFIYTAQGGSQLYDSGVITYTPPAASADNTSN